jgi:hypothetical protein
VLDRDMKHLTWEDRTFATQMGSDVLRDGMYLELIEVTVAGPVDRAEWFYSDADGSFAFTAWSADLSRTVLAWFEAEARRRLPPSPPAV